MKYKNTLGDKMFTFVSYFIVIFFALLCVLPFLYVLGYSLMPYSQYLENPINFIPKSLDFGAYKEIFKYPTLYTGYRNTLFITVVGTFLNVFLLIVSAYPLSKKDLKGQKVILGLILFTMLFSGGMIPRYYLVRKLNLLNSLWAMILPGAISAYNLILMKSFIERIPDSLEESAFLDGASEIRVLFQIVLPLSLPAIAAFTVMCGVVHWNSFFDAVIFTSKRDVWPLMLVLREMVSEGGAGALQQIATESTDVVTQTFTIQMAMIVVTILPIVTIYPFAQKYFITGLTIGGVKG